MAFPVVPAIGLGLSVAGSLFGSKSAEPRDFFDWHRRFVSEFGPDRFGLSPEEYRTAVTQGTQAITKERDVASLRSVESFGNAGLGRSAQAATSGIRSAAVSEQAFGRLMHSLASLDASVARQMRSDLFTQSVGAFNAQGAEDARVNAANQQGQRTTLDYISGLVDPLESYQLLSELKKIRALSYQPVLAYEPMNPAQPKEYV